MDAYHSSSTIATSVYAQLAVDNSQLSLSTPDDCEALRKLTVPIPQGELQRLQFLRETQLLDSVENEGDFARFTSLACRVFKTPIALVSLIDVSRQWFKARVGMDETETARDDGFCSYTILEECPDVMVVHDALLDPRFAANPLVLGSPDIRFYAGTPLRIQGMKIGTLCIIDRRPRSEAEFGESERAMLCDIGAMVNSLVVEKHQSALSVQSSLTDLLGHLLQGLQNPLKTLVDKKERLWAALTTSYAGHELGALLSDFQQSVELLHNLLEMRVQLARRAMGDKYRAHAHPMPKLKRCCFFSLLGTLRPLIHQLNSDISDSVWADSLLKLSQECDHLQLFSHPELLAVILSDIVGGRHHSDGSVCKFEACSARVRLIRRAEDLTMGCSNNIVESLPCDEGVTSCCWNVGELVLSMTHSLSTDGCDKNDINDLQHKLRSECQPLKQLLQWFGASLQMQYCPTMSLGFIQVVIPCRSLCKPRSLTEVKVVSSLCSSASTDTGLLYGHHGRSQKSSSHHENELLVDSLDDLIMSDIPIFSSSKKTDGSQAKSSVPVMVSQSLVSKLIRWTSSNHDKAHKLHPSS
jgi:hypothetical protein